MLQDVFNGLGHEPTKPKPLKTFSNYANSTLPTFTSLHRIMTKMWRGARNNIWQHFLELFIKLWFPSVIVVYQVTLGEHSGSHWTPGFKFVKVTELQNRGRLPDFRVCYSAELRSIPKSGDVLLDIDIEERIPIFDQKEGAENEKKILKHKPKVGFWAKDPFRLLKKDHSSSPQIST